MAPGNPYFCPKCHWAMNRTVCIVCQQLTLPAPRVADYRSFRREWEGIVDDLIEYYPGASSIDEWAHVSEVIKSIREQVDVLKGMAPCQDSRQAGYEPELDEPEPGDQTGWWETPDEKGGE